MLGESFQSNWFQIHYPNFYILYLDKSPFPPWYPGRIPALSKGLLWVCQVSVSVIMSNWYSKSLGSILSLAKLPCSEHMFVFKSENLSFLPEFVFLFSLWNSWFKLILETGWISGIFIRVLCRIIRTFTEVNFLKLSMLFRQFSCMLL